MTRRHDPFLRASLAIVACALAVAAVTPPPARAAEPLGPYQPGTVLVGYREEVAARDQDRALAAAGATPIATIGGGTRVVRVPEGTELQRVARLRATPSVRYAEPNYVFRAHDEPNDGRFNRLWGLHNTGQSIQGDEGRDDADIDAVEAWDVTTGSRDTVVGVVDTGIDVEHRDLAENLWSAPSAYSVTLGGRTITCPQGSHGFDAARDSCELVDRLGHGTHVSGTIGAVGDNGRGVTGVNWTASIMGLGFLNAQGMGFAVDAIEAIDFAVAVKERFGSGANIRVLNASWGGGPFSQALLDAIERAGKADILFVASAGNAGLNSDFIPSYPASYKAANIVSVAATDNRDELADFSNYGATSVDLGAPGVDILSTLPADDYDYLSGTSMAAPHVSGAAALVLAACDLDTAKLKATLLDNVDEVESLQDRTVTGGRLNVDQAIRTCDREAGGPGAPDAPKDLDAEAADGEVKLSWDAVEDATSYTVKRSLDRHGPFESIADELTSTSYTDDGVANGTRYHYVVSALNAASESPDSRRVSAKPHGD